MIMKSYTDVKQSKKLANILPLESADMHYATWTILDNEFIVSPNQGSTIKEMQEDYGNQIIPCWSLAALLGLIPYNVTFNRAVYCFKLVKFSGHWECYHENFGTVSTEIFKADNPINACYEMILKLHELNLL